MQLDLIYHLVERFFLARLEIVIIVIAARPHTAFTARVVTILMVQLDAYFLLIGGWLIFGCLAFLLAAVSVTRRRPGGAPSRAQA